MANDQLSNKPSRPMVATDCVIFGFDDKDLKVLLVERGIEPFKGSWALPGGFLREGENTEQGARRELMEETGLKDFFIEQLYTFSDAGRDPRGWVISVVYFSLINRNAMSPEAGDDAERAEWFALDSLPALAFDHAHILEVAVARLKGKLRYQPIGFELLPQEFTLPQLQALYEAVLQVQLDKRNFRKKIMSMELLEIAGKRGGTVGKPATTYRFNKQKYEDLTQKGFNFEV